jgi:hypothetical protein
VVDVELLEEPDGGVCVPMCGHFAGVIAVPLEGVEPEEPEPEEFEPEEPDPEEPDPEEPDPEELEPEDVGVVVDVEPLDPVVADVDAAFDDDVVEVDVEPPEVVLEVLDPLEVVVATPDPVLAVEPVVALATTAPPRTSPAAMAPAPIMFRTLCCIALSFRWSSAWRPPHPFGGVVPG